MAKKANPGRNSAATNEALASARALKAPVAPRLAINQQALGLRYAVSPMTARHTARIAKIRKALGQ